MNKIFRTSCITRVGTSFCNYSTNTSSNYCLDLVKRFDYENFMAVLLLKNTSRSTALAVRSFNVELSRVTEQTSQVSTGQARLQFWDDTIEACFNTDVKKIPQHPVALEIYKAVNRSKLSKRYFKNLIKCRYDYLNRNFFITLDEMEKYSENTVSNLYYLILEGCGMLDAQSELVASHLGKAQGILNLLRGCIIARKLNFISIPQELLVKHKVSDQSILNGVSSQKLNSCVSEVAGRAYEHLQKARHLSDKLPDNCAPVFLPAVTIDGYLTKLQVVNYDIFHPSLKRKPLLWLPKLIWYKYRNKY
ncbi:NADH dehydrogenase (ubiquinone) complex I, assembly factor 6 [Coccinella septempunctata]|uniref:NADH dehydrogenase (ubiquinone) complex I, assembly factor 6 n=1 Tax=Coccinella septempunctata TaxID=41139 RepID=UPI001D07BA51|nr:NADH dehydrogenase (ubiquinone) complex I, assembly factor 6 [Coccinella septempunctata]